MADENSYTEGTLATEVAPATRPRAIREANSPEKS